MDGRDAEGLRPFLDLHLEMGEPDTEHPEECPRCRYDTVVTFPCHLVSPLGITVLPSARACLRCYQQTGDLSLSLVDDPRPCEPCAQQLHSLCLLAVTDTTVTCACAEAGHPA